MSALAALQQRFLASVQGRADAACADDLAHGRLPRDTGLRIYTHAYGARLGEALDNDHPVLGAYLGDELWRRMCEGYIAAHPSRYRSLRDFGVGLPAYLLHHEPFRAHPELAELAAFERRLLDSFDAADAARADWAALTRRAQADWPGLRLDFHPSLRAHPVSRNSVEIWRAIKAGETPPAVADADCEAWALWRDHERISRFRSLDAEEHAALRHYQRGGDFAGLCEALSAWRDPDLVPMTALGYLRQWCDEGWVSRWV